MYIINTLSFQGLRLSIGKSSPPSLASSSCLCLCLCVSFLPPSLLPVRAAPGPMQGPGSLQGLKEGVRSSTAEVTDSDEPPEVRTRNRTLVVLESYVFFISEPSLQPVQLSFKLSVFYLGLLRRKPMQRIAKQCDQSPQTVRSRDQDTNLDFLGFKSKHFAFL